MAIIGYARVSTKGQSLDIQFEQLQNAGAEKIYQEKISGVKRDRPKLNEMLDYLRDGDTLVVSKLDRIARSTRHLLEIVEALESKGVTFRILNIGMDTSTPQGKLMLTMLGAIATFERELMLERQAEGIAKAKAEGKYRGRKPTARAKAEDVKKLIEEGHTKKAVAEKVGIGIASVYRVLKS